MNYLRLVAWCVLAASSAAQARLCGTQWLHLHGGELPRPRPRVVAQRPEEIVVGTPMRFLHPFLPGFLVAATCRYVGPHAYIFVEDAQWFLKPDGSPNDGQLTPGAVEALGRLFDESTPVDAGRGIFDLEVEAFGAPPDEDGYERVFIIIMAFADKKLKGLFDKRVISDPDPNFRRDAIYLNAFSVLRERELARGTLAHEFQHLIHWGLDPDEEDWINEGLSGYAEELTGYAEVDPVMVPAFLENTNDPLLLWRNQPFNYGSGFLFMSFLAQRYGLEFIRRLVAEPRNGVAGIDAAFRKSGLEQDFTGAWGQWSVGNYAADDERYAYDALRGRRVKTFALEQLPVEGLGGRVLGQWGTLNVVVRRAGNLSVEFDGEDNARFAVWAYALRGGVGKLQRLELDEFNRGRADAAQVDSLALIIGGTSISGGAFTLSVREFVPTAVALEPQAGAPQRFELAPAFPNPFNGAVVLPFEVGRESEVELSVFNSLGQRLRVLERGRFAAGRYRARWDGRDDRGRPAGSGTYFAVLRAGELRLSRKLSFVK